MRSYDVLVIGGGLIGGAIAWRLAQAELRVCLLEGNEPGREASWAAAGMLSPAPDSAASIPLVPFGRASLALYPTFVAELEDITGSRTGYRREGAMELLFASDAERELSTLIALHHGLGLPTEPLPLDEARRLEPAIGREARAAALLPYEESVNNRALTEAIFSAAAISGVQVHSNMRVSRLIREGNRCLGVEAGANSFSAGHVVLAAGAACGQIEGLKSRAAIRPIRGQMVALRNSDIRLRRVLRSEHGYLVPRDDASPQHIVTGSTVEDVGFEKRVTPRGIERILCVAQELVPTLANAEIIETWCGLRPDTPDHLPLLGPGELDGLTVATGHYRNGILLAPITAKLVSEWITENRVSIDWGIFDPLRFAAPTTNNTDEGTPSESPEPPSAANSSTRSM